MDSTADPASWQEYEHHSGVTARLRGALSLVNLLWAVAIGGVVVSVGPALYVLASPFQRLLATVFMRAAAVITQVPQHPRPGHIPCQSACRAGATAVHQVFASTSVSSATIISSCGPRSSVRFRSTFIPLIYDPVSWF